MNGTHTTPKQHAESDFASIAQTAEAILKVSGTYEETGTACIVDGTQYSPSTRALAGGMAAYYADETGEAMEEYHEALDELCSDWSAKHDVGLYWEDGCLWLER